MENHTKMDGSGVHLFQETSIWHQFAEKYVLKGTLKFCESVSSHGKVCSPSKLLGSSAVSQRFLCCWVSARCRRIHKTGWNVPGGAWHYTKGSQARSFRFCPQGWLREENYQNHLGRRTSPWNTTRCTFPGLFLAPWLLLCKPRWHQRGLPSTYGVFVCAVHHENNLPLRIEVSQISKGTSLW